MQKLKIIFVIIFTLFITTSCSLVDKIKEKMSKKDGDTKEQTVDGNEKEKTVSGDSGEDLNFYNKYIDVANKIEETGDGLNKSYIEDIPAPKSIRKGMILVSIAFDFKVSDFERVLKDQKRSFLDGGELSKLTASKDMKSDIEGAFKNLLDVMDGYYGAAQKTSDYFKDKDYESDPSKAPGLDDEMKSQYTKFKDAFDKFNGLLKKYKPKRKNRDPESISDPDKKSVAILMDAYENTLDGAEGFYDKLKNMDKSSDPSSLQAELSAFQSGFETDKNKVESAPFTDKTKYLKYSFEDYFTKTVTDFTKATQKFIDGGNKKESEFNRGYDNVVTYYNYMINAYNTNIGTINTMNQYSF